MKSKFKEYSCDSEGHIKYWYNPTRRYWEVFNTLTGYFLESFCVSKKDAYKNAQYHYNNDIYAYAIPDNQPVKRIDLTSLAMVNKNENKFTKIIRVDGKKFDWVGIGWIETNN